MSTHIARDQVNYTLQRYHVDQYTRFDAQADSRDASGCSGRNGHDGVVWIQD